MSLSYLYLKWQPWPDPKLALAWSADEIEVGFILNFKHGQDKLQISNSNRKVFVISSGQQKKFDCYLVFLAICLSI